jgi:hypothetical protein
MVQLLLILQIPLHSVYVNTLTYLQNRVCQRRINYENLLGQRYERGPERRSNYVHNSDIEKDYRAGVRTQKVGQNVLIEHENSETILPSENQFFL